MSLSGTIERFGLCVAARESSLQVTVNLQVCAAFVESNRPVISYGVVSDNIGARSPFSNTVAIVKISFFCVVTPCERFSVRAHPYPPRIPVTIIIYRTCITLSYLASTIGQAPFRHLYPGSAATAFCAKRPGQHCCREHSHKLGDKNIHRTGDRTGSGKLMRRINWSTEAHQSSLHCPLNPRHPPNWCVTFFRSRDDNSLAKKN
jgi:hypothetical protein